MTGPALGELHLIGAALIPIMTMEWFDTPQAGLVGMLSADHALRNSARF
ncbi:MAG: hypothetical protein O2821_01420 [Chloroflexi bacterium]|nr:hypothetical protein [Chloroflexota bacterium]MDA1227139.1 hypothetical protein [Chloroflexota bacterium]